MIGTGKARPKKPTTTILEGLTHSAPQGVDRDSGILKGVKVVGFSSDNDRRYTPEALKEAIPLYESAKVFLDHPEQPDKNRSVRDYFGWLSNVQLKEDGLYADLHIANPQTELAEAILSTAEKNPKVAIGLSHNCLGQGHDDRGTFVVDRITELRSVDLVSAPASTANFFESRNKKMKTTLRALLESVKLAKPKAQKALKALLEDDSVPLDMELDAPADAAPSDDGLGALHDAIAGVTKSGNYDLAKKIISLIQREQEAPAAAETTEAEDDEESDDDEEEVAESEDDDKEKEAKESRQPKKRQPSTCSMDRALDLCEDHKIVPDRTILRTLTALTEDGAKALLQREKKLTESRSTSTWNDPPRSRGQGSGRNGNPPPAAKNADSLLEALTSRN